MTHAAQLLTAHSHPQVLDDPEELVVAEIVELWAGDVNLGALPLSVDQGGLRIPLLFLFRIGHDLESLGSHYIRNYRNTWLNGTMRTTGLGKRSLTGPGKVTRDLGTKG